MVNKKKNTLWALPLSMLAAVLKHLFVMKSYCQICKTNKVPNSVFPSFLPVYTKNNNNNNEDRETRKQKWLYRDGELFYNQCFGEKHKRDDAASLLPWKFHVFSSWVGVLFTFSFNVSPHTVCFMGLNYLSHSTWCNSRKVKLDEPHSWGTMNNSWGFFPTKRLFFVICECVF